MFLYPVDILQFTELECLGYNGFAIAFCGEKRQLVGTQSVLPSFSPRVLEYLHAIVIAGRYIFKEFSIRIDHCYWFLLQSCCISDSILRPVYSGPSADLIYVIYMLCLGCVL